MRPRYLIYDVMQIEVSDSTLADQLKIGYFHLQKNQEVSLCDHKTRLLCATRELIEPREEAVSAEVKINVNSVIKHLYYSRQKKGR